MGSNKRTNLTDLIRLVDSRPATAELVVARLRTLLDQFLDAPLAILPEALSSDEVLELGKDFLLLARNYYEQQAIYVERRTTPEVIVGDTVINTGASSALGGSGEVESRKVYDKRHLMVGQVHLRSLMDELYVLFDALQGLESIPASVGTVQFLAEHSPEQQLGDPNPEARSYSIRKRIRKAHKTQKYRRKRRGKRRRSRSDQE